MDKNVEVSAGADLDLVRDQARAFFLQVFDGRREVADP